MAARAANKEADPTGHQRSDLVAVAEDTSGLRLDQMNTRFRALTARQFLSASDD